MQPFALCGTVVRNDIKRMDMCTSKNCLSDQCSDISHTVRCLHSEQISNLIYMLRGVGSFRQPTGLNGMETCFIVFVWIFCWERAFTDRRNAARLQNDTSK